MGVRVETKYAVAYAAIIASCAVLNHIRGGAVLYGPAISSRIKGLPGRPLYYVSPLVGLLVYAISRDGVFAAASAIGYFVWGLLAWGRMFDLGGLPNDTDRRGEPVSDAILRWLPPSVLTDAFAMLVRECYAVVFMSLVLWHFNDAGLIWMATLWYALAAVLLRRLAMYLLHETDNQSLQSLPTKM